MASRRELIADLERELRELEARRGELDRAIARMHRTIAWLRRHAARETTPKDVERGAQSLTNYCRAVLRMSAPAALTPKDVKRIMTEGGFEWDRFSNPMAALHTVLKRLVQQQEAIRQIDRDGEQRYALRRITVLPLTRQDLGDEGFLRKLLEAGSPDAILELVKDRRAAIPRQPPRRK